MIGRAVFRIVNGSKSTNEYPRVFVRGSSATAHSVGFTRKPTADAPLTMRDGLRFTDDPVQTIIVPEFDDWEYYNLVFLIPVSGIEGEGAESQPVFWSDSKGNYYWVTAVRRSSDTAGALEFTLEWNGPTTLASRMGTMVPKGMWQFMPTQENPNLRVRPVSGTAVPQRYVGFEDAMTDWVDSKKKSHRMGWITFTTTDTCNSFFGDGGDDAGTVKEYTYTRGGQSINPTEGGAVKKGEGTFVWDDVHYTPYIQADIGGYNIYGFPVMLEQFDAPSSATHVGIVCFSDEHTQKKDDAEYTTPITPFIRDAPTVWDVMSNQESLGFTAEAIVDVSFSFSCPFGYEFYTGSTVTSDGTDWRKDPHTGEERPIIALRIDPDKAICDGDTVTNPQNSVVQVCFRPNNKTGLPNFFICRGYTGAGDGEWRGFLTGNIPSEKKYTSNTLTIDNRYEQTVAIRDYNGVIGQEIPLDLFTVKGNTGTLVFETHIHCDYDGMFRHIIVGSGETAMQYSFDEPKLPWTANAWQSYKAQSMNDDRNAVIANLGFSVAGTLMGGVLGSGLMGAGATVASTVASQAGRKVGIAMGPDGAISATLADPASMATQGVAGQQLAGSVGQGIGSGMMGAVQQAYGQRVKERAIQRQPTQACNMGYGLNQVIVSKEYPPGFIISYPNGTEEQLESYIAKNGFPVQMYVPIDKGNFEVGYYQGIIYSNATVDDFPLTGIRLDMLNNAFMQGVLFVDTEEQQ